jgi:hypothetical protein
MPGPDGQQGDVKACLFLEKRSGDSEGENEEARGYTLISYVDLKLLYALSRKVGSTVRRAPPEPGGSEQGVRVSFSNWDEYLKIH